MHETAGALPRAQSLGRKRNVRLRQRGQTW
jgi:hypothetical protein